ncbi:delta-latroinsectotoxin-Lt1a-like [Parasteatoda tepidariorum]|uniref:delta-latroinsectotoxin-Lt1a-like n=1 Tax=Parasteatoda tepidariorum TaxID=114398 RepID=UPI0039BC5F79
MRINQTVVVLAVAKRDADNNSENDPEYDKAMEEIESRKNTCKKLEYAKHGTELVTNLIGDIPDIPLVTTGAKVVTSGIAAATHIAEFGINIAATAMECDDVNFDEIKLIMDKRFNEVDRKLDKLTEAMEKVTDMVTKTLSTVEKTRQEMEWGFKNVLVTLKNHDIQAIISKISKFSRYFEEKKDEVSKLPADQFVFRLKQKDGILDYLKKVRLPEGLHSDLFELMDKNTNFSIPENANDSKAFQALYALFYGTQTYASVMFFLLKQHSYLADYYYQRGQDKKFNEEFDLLVTTFNEFKTSLTGTNGLINAVVATLDNVKNKRFIKFVNDQLYKDISKRIDGLKNLKYGITKMRLAVIEDTPEPVVDIDFNEPDIRSNYGDWDDKSKVRYALQFRVDGIYSKFSEWTEPLKIDRKANPTIHISIDEKGRERLVFRKFNEEKPQLAKVLTKYESEFRDIDRDLYNAARSKDETRPLQYIPSLLNVGANIDAVFEMKRSVMHAAAESGNVKIAMRFLLDVKKELFDAVDEKGYTAMHVAASTKNAGFINFLITHNADVNARTNADKLTALHIAAKRGHYNTIKNLLASDKIEINKPEKSGYTPLHYAVRGTPKALKILLDDDKISVNAKSNFGLTPFHLAVMKGDRGICDALLSSGKVEVNAGNKDNVTPLHFAAMAGDVNMVQYLLSGKKEVEEVNINALTSENNWTPLHFAIYLKQEEATFELLKNEKVDISVTSKENYTPLHLSIATGQLKIFDELLKKGSNIESLTKEKFTALHLAVLRSEMEFTTKLLDKNARINAVSDDGSTPLHLAAKADRTDQAVLLISRGANMRLYDSKNFLPLQYVIKNMNFEVLRAAANQDPSIVDLNQGEGKALGEYCGSFLIEKMYYYYKNKDSVEYSKYKGLQLLDVFKKLGLYDLLRILGKNDTSPHKEDAIKFALAAASSVATQCIKDNRETCPFTGVRYKRSIEKSYFDYYQYLPKLQPLNFAQNAFNIFKIVSSTNQLEAKQTNNYQSFSHSITPIVQNVDTNGILLLFDILIRKFTNEKYTMNVNKSTSTLESQATALEVIDKFSAFVDSVSDVPAEELIDLAKLHSDVYKSLESGDNNIIFDLFCQHLRKIVDEEQVAAFLSSIKTDNEDQNQENSVNTMIQYCLSEAYTAP